MFSPCNRIPERVYSLGKARLQEIPPVEFGPLLRIPQHSVPLKHIPQPAGSRNNRVHPLGFSAQCAYSLENCIMLVRLKMFATLLVASQLVIAIH